MSSKINMIFSKTTETQHYNSKNVKKPIHPQIIKMMSNPHNIAKPVTKEVEMMSSMIMNNKIQNYSKTTATLPLPSMVSKPKLTNAKDFEFPLQNKKSFTMNFSQLSTGKPCGSCGGR